jgi:hypothetical protein
MHLCLVYDVLNIEQVTEFDSTSSIDDLLLCFGCNSFDGCFLMV